MPDKPAMSSVRAVSRTYVRPFEAGDVPAAGALLAQRHARHRLTRPLLPARYEEAAAAVAAAGWAGSGLTAHYALVPATDAELVRAWFRLGFGQQHCHALRALPEQPPERPAGVTIRHAVRDDIPVLAELEVELPRHQSLAPVFSAVTVPPA